MCFTEYECNVKCKKTQHMGDDFLEGLRVANTERVCDESFEIIANRLWEIPLSGEIDNPHYRGPRQQVDEVNINKEDDDNNEDDKAIDVPMVDKEEEDLPSTSKQKIVSREQQRVSPIKIVVEGKGSQRRLSIEKKTDSDTSLKSLEGKEEEEEVKKSGKIKKKKKKKKERSQETILSSTSKEKEVKKVQPEKPVTVKERKSSTTTQRECDQLFSAPSQIISTRKPSIEKSDSLAKIKPKEDKKMDIDKQKKIKTYSKIQNEEKKDTPSSSSSSSTTAAAASSSSSSKKVSKQRKSSDSKHGGGSSSSTGHSSKPSSSKQPSVKSAQPEPVKTNRQCLRVGCNEMAVKNPEWDGEYCSHACCVKHCRDIFSSWVLSNKESTKKEAQ